MSNEREKSTLEVFWFPKEEKMLFLSHKMFIFTTFQASENLQIKQTQQQIFDPTAPSGYWFVFSQKPTGNHWEQLGTIRNHWDHWEPLVLFHNFGAFLERLTAFPDLMILQNVVIKSQNTSKPNLETVSLHHVLDLLLVPSEV